MTHFSFVLLLAGFAVLAAAGDGTGFAAMARVDPPTRARHRLAFVLLVARVREQGGHRAAARLAAAGRTRRRPATCRR